MPAPTRDVIVAPKPTTIDLNPAPAHNALHSLLLLLKVDEVSGLDPWVTETAARLTAEEVERHRLVMDGFYYAIRPDRWWSSFPAYLEHLEQAPPTRLCDKMITALLQLPAEKKLGWPADRPLPDKAQLLESEESYLSFLQNLFRETAIDETVERAAYRYLVDPPALRKLLVSHLRHMWDRYLAAEWERVAPMLQEAVDAFRQTSLEEMDRSEAFVYVTGRAVPDQQWQNRLEQAARVVFVPSAHVGPYMGLFSMDNTTGVVFGARLPEGLAIDAPNLSRAEIVVRLSALADDTRLRILKLVAEEGEQRSQTIMERLNLSQSAASRHLKQLSATGYLTERRCEGAKCYRLNEDRVEITLRAVAAFLIGQGR